MVMQQNEVGIHDWAHTCNFFKLHVAS